MNVFSEWIRNIVFITMTITLLNMIIPESMGKYVKVIAGFLVMLVIIKPAADFMNADITLNTLFAKHMTIMDQQVDTNSSTNSQTISQNQDRLTVEVFKEKLQKNIQTKLSDEIGYKVDVLVKINEDLYSDDFGQLIRADILVLEKTTDDSITLVPKISILNDEGEEDEMDPKITKKINNFFLNFYNLEEKNIFISKKDKSMGGEN